MLHTAEAIAIAQSRRQSLDDFWDDFYGQLESRSTAVDGTVWEARIDYVAPDGMGATGHIFAAKSFGTLLATLHAQGFMHGEQRDGERLASVRRIPA